jgi:uncharacterized protein (UPF0332 family)
MKQQTSAFLDSAEESLADARRILAINIPRQAARLAYYAQFRAAQALIFERTEKIAKTHKGVDRQFHRLARDEAGLSSPLAATLTAAYHFKEAADYETGIAAIVSNADAGDAIDAAESFVAAVRHALTSSSSRPRVRRRVPPQLLPQLTFFRVKPAIIRPLWQTRGVLGRNRDLLKRASGHPLSFGVPRRAWCSASHSRNIR